MVTAIEKSVNPAFEDFLFDWNHRTYFLVGGYGSSKSYHAALKLVLKLLQEKRTALVVREVYDTHRDSTFSLISEIVEDLGLVKYIKSRTSPLEFRFSNGSKIIFKGMDKPEKLKSINNVSIVWLEECSEIKYTGYKELIGRLRHPYLSLHMILTTNPVSKDNWSYTHFFIDEENDRIVLDDERLYKEKVVVVGDTYYHHSTADDNLFLPSDYLEQLEGMKEYDPDLYRIARKGRFGVNGKLVLPQLEVWEHADVMEAIRMMPKPLFKNGMDFGFVESFNTVLRMCVDRQKEWLYIYWEYYKRGITDDEFAKDLEEAGLKKELTKADNAEPKTIRYLQKKGFRITACHKLTRLENTKKMKRFKKIIVSTDCPNAIRELKNLTFKVDPKSGKLIEDEFNIDSHCFSAMWYGLDDYDVTNLKGYSAKKRRW